MRASYSERFVVLVATNLTLGHLDHPLLALIRSRLRFYLSSAQVIQTVAPIAPKEAWGPEPQEFRSYSFG